MTKKIVSAPGVVGSRPTVEGTRMTCADVAFNLRLLGLEEFRRIYPRIEPEDIEESLRFCSTQSCLATMPAFCQACEHDPQDPDDPDDVKAKVWLLSAELLKGFRK